MFSSTAISQTQFLYTAPKNIFSKPTIPQIWGSIIKSSPLLLVYLGSTSRSLGSSPCDSFNLRQSPPFLPKTHITSQHRVPNPQARIFAPHNPYRPDQIAQITSCQRMGDYRL